MSGTSDGTRTTRQAIRTRQLLKDQINKTRSQSCGDELAHFEIDSQADDNKKTDPKINTPKQQVNVNNMEIPGISQNICEPDETYDSVFKKRSSLLRSPVKLPDVNTDLFLDGNSKKRNRSRDTPEKPCKKQCEESQCEASTEIEPNATQNIIQMSANESNKFNIIVQALDNIESIVNKKDTLIEMEDLRVVNKATYALLRNLTEMIHHIAQLEKENLILKQCKKSDIISPIGKSYANVAAAEDNLRYKTMEKPAPWTTPLKKPPKIETIIRIPENGDASRTIRQLKENVKDKDLGGGLKSIRPTRDGAVVVESHSREQQIKLGEILRDSADQINIKEIKQTDPMFMLTGIEKGFENESFIAELIQGNPDVKSVSSNEELKKIQVVTKIPCRNQNKENWILKAPAMVTKWFLKKGTVNFDLIATYVQEYHQLALCFKCCGYGHVSKYCKWDDVCYKCSGKHSAKECETTNFRCINCTQMGYKEVSHTARDKECPIYKRKLERVRQNTNYDSSTNF